MTIYDIAVCRHSIDGIKLLLNQLPEDDGDHLILCMAGVHDASMFFGYALPVGYPGLAGLLHYAPKSLAAPVNVFARQAHIIFTAPELGEDRDYGCLLDRVRDHFEPDTRVGIVVPYRYAHRHMPPLRAGETVTCYWEARDLLTVECVEAFRFLTERSRIDGANFSGLHLYTRTEHVLEEVSERHSSIEQAAGLTPGNLLVAA